MGHMQRSFIKTLLLCVIVILFRPVGKKCEEAFSYCNQSAVVINKEDKGQGKVYQMDNRSFCSHSKHIQNK